jgi:hypothetical protein
MKILIITGSGENEDANYERAKKALSKIEGLIILPRAAYVTECTAIYAANGYEKCLDACRCITDAVKAKKDIYYEACGDITSIELFVEAGIA